MCMGSEKNFLGLDLSTQKLKAVVSNEDLKVLCEAEVEFDSELPEFRTSGGVCRHENGEVLAPPIMWVKALDIVLDKLVLAGTDFSKIVALSGAAQQHGSVWWSTGSLEKLRKLSNEEFLHQQLAGCFAADSPVWLDSSTSADCRAMEQVVGGAKEMAIITGSTAYERFTGPQIRKMFRSKPRVYHSTERISLVSSFVASLLLGDYAPIDYTDGSGMNLLDIHMKKWHPELLKECGDDSLSEKLGEPVPTDSAIGNVAKYFVERFGFNPQCKVIAFTGDNPSALAGLKLQANWIGISLGTSDTVLVGLTSPPEVPPETGHILLGPTKQCPYMALLCFSNGSLTRQQIRDEVAAGSWDVFNSLINDTVRGNLGNLGIFFTTNETVPRAAICRRIWSANEKELSKLSPALTVRALLEGQALARRYHATEIGVKLDDSSRIIATGGASANKELLQIFADVFNAPLYVQEDHSNAALMGAVVRAIEVWSRESGVAVRDSDSMLTPVATPYKDSKTIYGPMLERYKRHVYTLPKLE